MFSICSIQFLNSWFNFAVVPQGEEGDPGGGEATESAEETTAKTKP